MKTARRQITEMHILFINVRLLFKHVHYNKNNKEDKNKTKKAKQTKKSRNNQPIKTVMKYQAKQARKLFTEHRSFAEQDFVTAEECLQFTTYIVAAVIFAIKFSSLQSFRHHMFWLMVPCLQTLDLHSSEI